jgi:hypothetical protein
VFNPPTDNQRLMLFPPPQLLLRVPSCPLLQFARALAVDEGESGRFYQISKPPGVGSSLVGK